MTWIVKVKYNESSDLENHTFNIGSEAVTKIAELLRSEGAENDVLANVTNIKHIEGIQLMNTVTNTTISL